jgi:hypothetical protein
MATPGSPTRQLASFIAKFDPAMQRRIRAVRAALRKRFPTANELVYDNYNFFVIGYCSTERPSDAIVSMAANSKGVGLCFIYGASLPDPQQRLSGSGSQTRFVRLPSPATLSEPAIAALLRAAIAESDPPLPRTGRGRLIIRSISAKQRPRR